MSDKGAKPDNAEGTKKPAAKKKDKGPKYSGYDLDCFLSPQDVLTAVRELDQSGFFLEDISCLDIQEGLFLVYHFDRYEQPGRVGLRVLLDRNNPKVPSIFDIYPGAAWHERECFDFFGVRFTGHPNLIPLLLDPDSKGLPPLLKDESERRGLEQILPEHDSSPVSVQSQEFIQKIHDCSKTHNRTQS
jgi:NADH-quinone oxidoreductase subunit C